MMTALPPASLAVPNGSAHDWEPSLSVPVPLGHAREEALRFDDAGLSRWLGGGGGQGEWADVTLFVELPPTGGKVASAAAGSPTGAALPARVCVGTARLPLRSLLLSEDLTLETTLDLVHASRRRGVAVKAGDGESGAVDGRKQAFLAGLELEGPARARVERLMSLREGLVGSAGTEGAPTALAANAGAARDAVADARTVAAEPGAAPLPASEAGSYSLREVVARLRVRLSLQLGPEIAAPSAPISPPDFMAELRSLPWTDTAAAAAAPLARLIEAAGPGEGHVRDPVPRSSSGGLIPPSRYLGSPTSTRLANRLLAAATLPASLAPVLVLSLRHAHVSARDALIAARSGAARYTLEHIPLLQLQQRRRARAVQQRAHDRVLCSEAGHPVAHHVLLRR